MIFLPFLTAILNRFRGDDTVSKGVWIAIMASLSLLVTHDPVIIAAWTVYILAYAVGPWHAMFSAVTSLPPSRQDGIVWQWMQDVSLNVCKLLPSMPVTRFWRIYGMVYGAIRALPAMIPVMLLYGYTDNPLVLTGCGLLFMGVPYYVFKRLLRKNPNHGDMPVVYSELAIGYFLGGFLLTL